MLRSSHTLRGFEPTKPKSILCFAKEFAGERNQKRNLLCYVMLYCVFKGRNNFKHFFLLLFLLLLNTCIYIQTHCYVTRSVLNRRRWHIMWHFLFLIIRYLHVFIVVGCFFARSLVCVGFFWPFYVFFFISFLCFRFFILSQAPLKIPTYTITHSLKFIWGLVLLICILLTVCVYVRPFGYGGI